MNELPYETDTDAWYFKHDKPSVILYLDHDKSTLHAMQYSMKGKLMHGKRHMYSIFCMRCGKYHANWADPCVCLPLWTCMDSFSAELCREQQCVYCVGMSPPPKRYHRIFNVHSART